MPHKFKIGQTVRCGQMGRYEEAWWVISFLPQVGNGEPEYRIKRLSDGEVWVAKESVLRPI